VAVEVAAWVAVEALVAPVAVVPLVRRPHPDVAVPNEVVRPNAVPVGVVETLKS
jgi:hypothetical protein